MSSDVPGIAPIAGPLLIGFLLNWGLLGILTAQVYQDLYHIAFPADRLVLKAAVWVIFVLEALQTSLLTKSQFRSFGAGFGNPRTLDNVDIIWFSVPMLCGIVASISQMFYSYRLWVITQSKALVGVILLLSAVQLGGALALGVQNKDAALFSRLYSDNSRGSFITTSLWKSCSATCDVLIAGFMTYHLKKKKSRIKETRALLSGIIRLTIQTGVFTAAIAISVLVLIYLPGHPTYYQAAVAVLGKAYSNSMLVALNSRVRVTAAHKLCWNEDAVPDRRANGVRVLTAVTLSQL